MPNTQPTFDRIVPPAVLTGRWHSKPCDFCGSPLTEAGHAHSLEAASHVKASAFWNGYVAGGASAVAFFAIAHLALKAFA